MTTTETVRTIDKVSSMFSRSFKASCTRGESRCTDATAAGRKAIGSQYQSLLWTRHELSYKKWQQMATNLSADDSGLVAMMLQEGIDLILNLIVGISKRDFTTSDTDP